MDLYLLRHGEVGKRVVTGQSSSMRSLTIEGQAEIESISKSIKDLGVSFDYIITSPLIQAQETASILAKVFKAQNKIHEWRELAPEGSRFNLYRNLSILKQESSVLLVGHNPYFSMIISEIITGEQLKLQQQDIEMRRFANNIGLKRGGLVRLEATFSNRGPK